MIKNKLEDRTNLAQVMEKLLVAIRKNNKLDSYSSNIQLQPIYRLVKNVPLSAAAPNSDRFREIHLSHPQISESCKNRFHPTEAVLACGSSNGQVKIFKAAENGSVSVSLSNYWRIEREFNGYKLKKITSLEWNVSCSNFIELTLSVWLFGPSIKYIF